MGRDIAYDYWSCDLLCAASSPDLYRINLEQVFILAKCHFLWLSISIKFLTLNSSFFFIKKKKPSIFSLHSWCLVRYIMYAHLFLLLSRKELCGCNLFICKCRYDNVALNIISPLVDWPVGLLKLIDWTSPLCKETYTTKFTHNIYSPKTNISFSADPKSISFPRSEHFPSSIIWNSLVPVKVGFFAWEAT